MTLRHCFAFAALATIGFAGPASAQFFVDDMSAQGAWTVEADPDTTFQFGYDYSADGLPAAPSGSDTTGLKLTVNNTAPAAAAQIGVFYEDFTNFTGEYTLLRSDLLYDTGRPASPAMDLGQVEGGFLQGVGLGTCEELRFDEESRLVTDNVWSYELPSATSIPVDFRLSLARTEPEVLDRLEAEGRLAVAGSKATGEPGVSTGNSVFFALRNALLAAREELGLDGWPALDAPATGFRLVGLLELPDEAFTE